MAQKMHDSTKAPPEIKGVIEFQIDAQSLEELATVVHFSAADRQRPILMNVLIELDGSGHIDVWATDSYRMATIQRSTVKAKTRKASFMFPAARLKKIAAEVKSLKVRTETGESAPRPISFAVTTDQCTVSDIAGGIVWTVPLYRAYSYPKVEELVPDRETWRSGAFEGAAFNPEFLAAFAKIAPFRAADETYRNSAIVQTIGKATPILVTSKDERTKLLLMPVRID